MHPSMLAAHISDWIRERVSEAGARGVVLGMSGGLDSSVAAVLCKRACPDTTLGLILPCKSPPEDVTHARLIAAQFDIETEEFDLSAIFTAFLTLLTGDERHGGAAERTVELAIANLKPRLRMICLYYFANKRNYLVVGTGNKSELTIGYFTKYGDGAADILPLGDVLKTEERALAEELGIPRVIIEKPPSAGLWAGQTDEGEIGMSYELLDRILALWERGDADVSRTACDPELVARVKQMAERSRHKREPIPIFRRTTDERGNPGHS
ncbi:MAG TPA: NAD+ synthase [Methanomicrobia archaeon]|nr:NAD+ synthase [Methanomicrobia archaeon]